MNVLPGSSSTEFFQASTRRVGHISHFQGCSHCGIGLLSLFLHWQADFCYSGSLCTIITFPFPKGSSSSSADMQYLILLCSAYFTLYASRFTYIANNFILLWLNNSSWYGYTNILSVSIWVMDDATLCLWLL